MWTLIITYLSTTGDVATTSVPGFSSKRAAEAAAQTHKKNLNLSVFTSYAVVQMDESK